MDFYQWLLRNNGFKVSDDGYFVYCNGDKQKESFDNKVHFNVSVLKYTGDTSWIEKTIEKIKILLDNDIIPVFNEECDYCIYLQDLNSVT